MKSSTLKNLPVAWKDEADAMSTDQLRAAIVEATANLTQVERSAEEDKEFQKLKDAAKEAGAGYSDAKKALKAKIDYALHRLSEKGAIDLDADEEVLAAAKEVREGLEAAGMTMAISVGGKAVTP